MKAAKLLFRPASRRRLIAAAYVVVSLLLFAASAFAQPLSNIVFTVGTTIQDASLKNWSYLLLGSPQTELLAGKRFAVYGKAGLPTDPGTFTLHGTIFQQTDATAINNLLNDGPSLNDDTSGLDSALATLLRNIPGASGETLPQKILTAFQVAKADPGTMAVLTMLERTHPTLSLCAGQAFAEILSGTITYEVRELDPNTGAAGEVVGRVTIIPGSPVVLPAPGYPFQVVTNAPSDHLRIRLRWGTPDALRRLTLLQYGFNVWRIPQAAAISAGYNTTPPTTAQLTSDPNFNKVNSAPVMAIMDYAPLAGPGGPNDLSDRATYFFSDSNGRSPGNLQFPPGTTPQGYLVPPFDDGATFYYFVTARDILGRDGLVSPGGLATACRKVPPHAPTKLSVLNTVQALPLGGGMTTNQEHLQIRWQQNTNAADLVSEYWVYRWLNPSFALTNDASPSNNVIGIVAQVTNVNLNALLDSSPTSPGDPGPSNYWYTVRAVSYSSCGPLFSPNSAPASGVLRQRAAPPGTTGELVGSCGTPAVMFQNFNSLANPAPPDTNNWHYRVTVTRRDAGVAWAQFTAGNFSFGNTSTQSFGPLYFPPDGNSLSIDLTLPASGPGPEFDVSCVVGTYYGEVSQPAMCQTLTAVPPSQITEAVFQSGELLFTALNSSDPLLAAANITPSGCQGPLSATRDESGTIHMKFAVPAGTPMMIQYVTNQVWTDLGIATPDTNGVYSIYLCPCVINTLPTLRGCSVNLPAEGTCDQHVARAGDSGAIAPIHVRFRLTPRTHEYRMYRSVDGGAPTLISQAAARYDANNQSFEIVRTDDAMPLGSARLCYFVQLLDENGNGSPLSLIGCKTAVPPKPPRPVLSEPAPAGDTNHPQVALSWFCPTSGVYRFEIRVARADQQGSGKPSGLFNSRLLLLNSFKPLQAINPNAKPRFFGLLADRELISAVDEWQLTPPVGPNFGPGPQFSIAADIVPNVPYHISVAAEDNQGNWGDASTEWTFVWKPPPTIQTVPWPARPLPPTTTFDDPASVPPQIASDYAPRVAAVLFGNPSDGIFDIHYPVGIRFAFIPPVNQITLNVGDTNFGFYLLSGPSITPTTPGVDPNGGVFRRYATGSGSLLNGQSLLPMVVYRKQETNAAFPQVSGNLTQVTPLLEKVPWIVGGSPHNNVSVTIPDHLIALWQEGHNDRDYTFLYLRDQQPVILGARYHYYVARMNDQHEVAEIIDAGIVDIPGSP